MIEERSPSFALTAIVSADGGLHEVLHPVLDYPMVATSKVVGLFPVVNDLEPITRSRVRVGEDLVSDKLDVTLDLGFLYCRSTISSHAQISSRNCYNLH